MHMHGLRASVAQRSISTCKSKWHHHQYVHKAAIKFYRNITTTTIGSSAGSSLQQQIVKALRSDERKKASHLLQDFGHRSHSLSADDFVNIFKYCAQSPDPLFAMEIWRLMELKDISIDNTCSSLMMRALCKGVYTEEVFSIMDFLGESRCFYPLLPLYNSILSSYIKNQNLIQARKCLDLMEKQMMGKSEVTYTALLKLAVLQKNLPLVHIVWQEYIKVYSMSVISLRKFIWSFTRLGDLQSAYRTLQQMVSLAMKGNISIGRTVYGKLYSTRLDIPVPSNDGLCSTILDLRNSKQHGSCILAPPMYLPDTISASMEQQVILMDNGKAKCAEKKRLNGQKHSLLMKVLRWSFNDIIHGCAKEKNYMLAWKLILQMQNLGLQPSSHTYDGIIRAIVSQRSFGDAMRMFKKMQQENLKLYDSTLATLSITFSRELQLDLAESLLNQISECSYPHPYNALLASCDALNQPERAVRVFAKMRKIKLLPDMRTYELLFSLFGIVNAPYEDSNMLSQMDAAKRIDAIERDMANNGFQHSHLSLKNILKSLGEEGMIRELVQYLHVAENLFIYSNPSLGTDMYNIVLHYLVEAQESHKAIEIFKKMKLCGCHADSTTYNIMIDCCSIIRSYRSASLLISMMIREGFCPVACTYTALIKILLEDENFYEALNVLERIKLDGIKLDVLLFNTFLRQACYKERIDVIEFIVEFMHQEKVQPNPTTCGYVFSAYVNSSFHNTAIEALQVLSLRMMSEDGNILNERKSFVDEFILDEDLASESHLYKLFEDSEDEVAIALLNLRWCAIIGFPICESADQSLWAKRLESRFQKRLASGSGSG
ncbi:pentatricopeptide repeat-containing protein At1g76280-like isoform X1 [Trifolium pratense]|uniref:pentatricopeptide repeat-containing protein At1g76280-like isoform X1 n=1 Tax=Trifolium pratense TaxID=57577 RepID=UPI001E69047D|nr:pentatricopeptide repeat-containing protein At1g76280-like isoform X1 [Trifolium pratense]